VVKKIERDRIQDIAAALMEKGTLYAPVEDEEGVNFHPVDDAARVTLDFYNTVQGPKCAFFPQSDELVRYRMTHEGPEAVEVLPDESPQILFGVRPCDVRSLAIMDELFCGGGVVDPYWKNRRDNTTIIAYAFDIVDPVDFYGSFDIGAAEETGADILMVGVGGEFLLDARTEKGTALLAALDGFDDAAEGDKKRFAAAVKKAGALETRRIDTDGVDRDLMDIFDSDFWQREAAPCLNCGVCTFVCPTCHCFDINDETLFGEGRRVKTWDSCMFTDFTLHASGHNPRTKKNQRLRQRVNHKFSYYVTNFDVISCVGCGRCTRFCPVNIDIAGVVERARKRAASERTE